MIRRFVPIVLILAAGCAAPQQAHKPQTFEERFEALRDTAMRMNDPPTRICVLHPHERVEDIIHREQCPYLKDSIAPIDFKQRTTTLLVEVGDTNEVGVMYRENGGGNFTSFPLLPTVRQWNPNATVAAAIGTLRRGESTMYAEAMIRDFVLIEGTRFAVLEVQMPGIAMTEEPEIGAWLWVYVPNKMAAMVYVKRPTATADDTPRSSGGSPRYATAL